MPGDPSSVWSIEPLDETHDRAGFSCGWPQLDEFLHKLARQYAERSIGITFVAVPRGHKVVCGYYTLASGAIQPAILPQRVARKLPSRLPVPVIRLGRLAVDTQHRGVGLGGFLLADALHRTWHCSLQTGIYAVEVEAISDEAVLFYRHYGFIALADDPMHLYLPIRTIRQLFA